MVTVQCKTCGQLDVKDVKFLNIEEDIQGFDLVTFECPECGTVQKSNARGR